MNRIRRLLISHTILRRAIPCIAIFVAALPSPFFVRHQHRQTRDAEIEAIEKGVLDIYGYEWQSVLSPAVARYLPQSIVQDFEHITEIDLQFNDLTYCDPADIRDLHRCEWVHTLRVPNPTMTAEMFEAIIAFPRLEAIYYREWHDAREEHDVTLRTSTPRGIQVVLTP